MWNGNPQQHISRAYNLIFFLKTFLEATDQQLTIIFSNIQNYSCS